MGSAQEWEAAEAIPAQDGCMSKNGKKKRFLPTQREVAKHFQVSVRRVERWRQEGMPRKGKLGYSVARIERWRAKRYEETGRPGKKDANRVAVAGPRKDLLEAQARVQAARAELSELRLEVERGKLVSVEAVKTRDLARIAVVKNGLLALPKAVAHEIAGLRPKEIEAALTRRVRELLQKFSRM